MGAVVQVDGEIFQEWVDGINNLSDRLQLLGFVDSPLQTAIKLLAGEAEHLFDEMELHTPEGKERMAAA